MAPSQGDGAYSIPVPPGTYTIQAVLLDLYGGVAGGRPFLASASRTVTVTNGNVDGIDFGLVLPPTPHDARYFPQTGYRIDNDIIWDYFNRRDGVQTFGYSVSRAFPFLGFTTQIFQRQVVQVGGTGGITAHPMNLLDPGLMPINSINFSTFPAFDPSLANQAPSPSSPSYATDVVSFVQQHAPDTWNGLPVNVLPDLRPHGRLADRLPERRRQPRPTPPPQPGDMGPAHEPAGLRPA